MSSVRGRILYDFSGSACEGYALQFRQVSELDSGEGKVIAERPARHHLGRRRGQAVPLPLAELPRREAARRGRRAGRAGRRRASAVELTQAGRQEARSRRPIWCSRPSTCAASSPRRARARRCSQVSVYDGSETGEKVYDTLTVIGKPIAPGCAEARRRRGRAGCVRRLDALAGDDQLFRQGAAAAAGEQTPVYAITFELYENGISRALHARLRRFRRQRRDDVARRPEPCK